ncbi:MAG: DNA polymerase III subunit gamma/tau [Clostridium sp.]|nr:DNA polymerase III subunit gamma/tau [Clostridium sp.]
MAYTALYRKWRPKTFDDIIGQEHVTTTLKNQIANDRIAHAYLLCGTRGTGKTSTAKVMAKALNCLNPKEGNPCNECEMCKKISQGLAIDVTELDAASNNGIDKIRDIIDDTKYPPQEGKYKIYIMDEVHMLSMVAVNAFLKTLEEPPQNVIFILATTDPQRLPITILSRCQRFDFKRISIKDLTERLRTIVTAQGVLADDKSLDLIARVSDGAARDALSILDQAISMGDGSVNYDNLVEMLGLVTNEYLFDITSAIIEKNVEKAMVVIEKVVFAGKDMYLFIKDLIEHYRNLLMLKVTSNPQEVLDMSLENIKLLDEQSKRIRVEEIMRDIRILQEAEGNAKLSKQARLYLELAAIKMCKIEYDTSNEVILTRINKLEEAIKNGSITVVQGNKTEPVQKNNNLRNNVANSGNNIEKKPKTQEKNSSLENSNSLGKSKTSDVQRAWKDILETFKSRRAMIIFASIVTGKVVDCTDGIVTIKYDAQYSFNKQRLEKPENIKVINEVFSEVMRENLKVRFIVDGENEERKSTEDLIKDAMGDIPLEIFDE